MNFCPFLSLPFWVEVRSGSGAVPKLPQPSNFCSWPSHGLGTWCPSIPSSHASLSLSLPTHLAPFSVWATVCCIRLTEGDWGLDHNFQRCMKEAPGHSHRYIWVHEISVSTTNSTYHSRFPPPSHPFIVSRSRSKGPYPTFLQTTIAILFLFRTSPAFGTSQDSPVDYRWIANLPFFESVFEPNRNGNRDDRVAWKRETRGWDRGRRVESRPIYLLITSREESATTGTRSFQIFPHYT